MHLVLTSIGTDGDIIPYVGLGAVMRGRGHSVTLVASEPYRSFAERNDFAFEALVSTEENNELFKHPDFWKPLKTGQLSARWGVRFLRRQYDLIARITTPDTVLVTNPGVLAAGLVHETHRVPMASLILQPWLIPSSLRPPILPGFSLLAHSPPPVWKVIRYGINKFGDALMGRELNELRTSLGLKSIQLVFDHWLSEQLIIGLFPDWFGDPQADWPPQVRLTGFPKFDGQTMAGLAPELLNFCRAGKPPVVFTFGTGMAHPAELFREAMEACALLDCRAIFLTRFRDQLPETLPANIIHCSAAPFQSLFPQCAAVVHHGGIGTVAKAMAAGVPQLIHPQCFDQIDNGVRVKELGAGDCLRVQRSTAKKLATALVPLLTEAARQRSRELIPRFEKIDAFGAAAGLLEKLHAERGGKVSN